MPNDDWDALTTDPFHESLEEGRAEGRRDGAQAGYEEGYATGWNTAVEMGVEVGYMLGILNAVKQQEYPERVHKTLQDLDRLLDDFPDAERALSEEDDSEEDLRQSLQRIRARFKLLTVQLNRPEWTLTAVMEAARATEEVKSNDW